MEAEPDLLRVFCFLIKPGFMSMEKTSRTVTTHAQSKEQGDG